MATGYYGLILDDISKVAPFLGFQGLSLGKVSADFSLRAPSISSGHSNFLLNMLGSLVISWQLIPLL